MITGERRWDEDLIQDIFVTRDANLILSIPLCNDEVDRWYWRKEKLGFYSVKSAYILLQESKPNNNISGNKSVWKRLWNLKVPPKVKHFIWRAATGCLPTKVMLCQKHVNLNVFCPFCNMELETINHVLLNCSYAQGCWSILGGWMVEKRQMGVMLCWAIWKCRNNLVWNQRGLEITEVVESAKVVRSQWKKAQDNLFNHSWA
ncbi:hypothetical protein DCAR_0623969 [Daucus carota subsp. sativus]|uniref:Reverse transcriptase zinc-binding domain-containing protein n=1 Tax=Daucus carota subsp. sativus TaxID=79200 RepID=A0AAF0XCM0_DAUCS|nr:hypothetical protein DCAR_0623969 [Daucus carota subsp. sativus]